MSHFSVEAMSHGDAFVGMDDGLEDINEKKRQQNMETLVQKGPLSHCPRSYKVMSNFFYRIFNFFMAV